MEHIRKQLKKISKEMMKKGITTLVLLFFAMVMIFQKDSPVTELQFVRNADEVFMHNAANENAPASQRDYLFQNEAGNDVYQGQITDGQRRTEVTPPSTAENSDGNTYPNWTGTISTITTGTTPTITTGTLSGTLSETITWTLSEITTGVIETGFIVNIDEITQGINALGIYIATVSTEEVNTGTGGCITPWDEKVNNKDFVLAYQQRKDVNTICNIEKRVCKNGILWGTFTQSSCKEDVVYVYRKAEVISYNQKIINEYIQPTKPVNAGAEFNNEGKINAPIEKPTTTRGTSNSPVITKPTVIQTPTPTKASCTTPRGQTIKHGQFIKAYKTTIGLIDLPCNVEIRPCVNGKLKGSFTNPKCTFYNTTYNGYLEAGAPESNTWFFFFQRIKSIVQ